MTIYLNKQTKHFFFFFQKNISRRIETQSIYDMSCLQLRQTIKYQEIYIMKQKMKLRDRFQDTRRKRVLTFILCLSYVFQKNLKKIIAIIFNGSFTSSCKECFKIINSTVIKEMSQRLYYYKLTIRKEQRIHRIIFSFFGLTDTRLFKQIYHAST